MSSSACRVRATIARVRTTSRLTRFGRHSPLFGRQPAWRHERDDYQQHPKSHGCKQQDTERVCTATTKGSPGTDVFSVTTYDGTNATGDVLSVGTVRQRSVREAATCRSATDVALAGGDHLLAQTRALAERRQTRATGDLGGEPGRLRCLRRANRGPERLCRADRADRARRCRRRVRAARAGHGGLADYRQQTDLRHHAQIRWKQIGLVGDGAGERERPEFSQRARGLHLARQTAAAAGGHDLRAQPGCERRPRRDDHRVRRQGERQRDAGSHAQSRRQTVRTQHRG